jgi:hypothetical protein
VLSQNLIHPTNPIRSFLKISLGRVNLAPLCGQRDRQGDKRATRFIKSNHGAVSRWQQKVPSNCPVFLSDRRAVNFEAKRITAVNLSI